jgi:hypothetical protein
MGPPRERVEEFLEGFLELAALAQWAREGFGQVKVDVYGARPDGAPCIPYWGQSPAGASAGTAHEAAIEMAEKMHRILTDRVPRKVLEEWPTDRQTQVDWLVDNFSDVWQELSRLPQALLVAARLRSQVNIENAHAKMRASGNESRPTRQEAEPAETPSDPVAEAVRLMRDAIRRHGKGTPSPKLLAEAGGNRQSNLQALRQLEALGEYTGFRHKPHQRKSSKVPEP